MRRALTLDGRHSHARVADDGDDIAHVGSSSSGARLGRRQWSTGQGESRGAVVGSAESMTEFANSVFREEESYIDCNEVTVTTFQLAMGVHVNLSENSSRVSTPGRCSERPSSKRLGPRLRHVSSQESLGPARMLGEEEVAARKLQRAFRVFRARRRRKKVIHAILRLQALWRGHVVRYQAFVTLQCLHALVCIQAHVRGWLLRQSPLGRELRRQLHALMLERQKRQALKCAEAGWSSDIRGTPWDVMGRSQSREHAQRNRERARAYAKRFRYREQQQQRMQQKPEAAWRKDRLEAQGNTCPELESEDATAQTTATDGNDDEDDSHILRLEGETAGWGWSWLEDWMAMRPWHCRVFADAHDDSKLLEWVPPEQQQEQQQDQHHQHHQQDEHQQYQQDHQQHQQEEEGVLLRTHSRNGTGDASLSQPDRECSGMLPEGELGSRRLRRTLTFRERSRQEVEEAAAAAAAAVSASSRCPEEATEEEKEEEEEDHTGAATANEQVSGPPKLLTSPTMRKPMMTSTRRLEKSVTMPTGGVRKRGDSHDHLEYASSSSSSSSLSSSTGARRGSRSRSVTMTAVQGPPMSPDKSARSASLSSSSSFSSSSGVNAMREPRNSSPASTSQRPHPPWRSMSTSSSSSQATATGTERKQVLLQPGKSQQHSSLRRPSRKLSPSSDGRGGGGGGGGGGGAKAAPVGSSSPVQRQRQSAKAAAVAGPEGGRIIVSHTSDTEEEGPSGSLLSPETGGRRWSMRQSAHASTSGEAMPSMMMSLSSSLPTTGPTSAVTLALGAALAPTLGLPLSSCVSSPSGCSISRPGSRRSSFGSFSLHGTEAGLFSIAASSLQRARSAGLASPKRRTMSEGGQESIIMPRWGGAKPTPKPHYMQRTASTRAKVVPSIKGACIVKSESGSM